ncbi:MAG TPA: hypothetical protein VJ783_07090 [Pirellulales bacterium]|nr:hypothetical protein [Pirellulales bacterium]
MARRFQFSLRALLIFMLAVAIACAIWIRLPTSVRVAMISGTAWVFFCVPELLAHYGDPPTQPGPRYIVKWRQHRNKPNEE